MSDELFGYGPAKRVVRYKETIIGCILTIIIVTMLMLAVKCFDLWVNVSKVEKQERTYINHIYKQEGVIK